MRSHPYVARLQVAVVEMWFRTLASPESLTNSQIRDFFHLTFYSGASLARNGKAIAEGVFKSR